MLLLLLLLLSQHSMQHLPRQHSAAAAAGLQEADSAAPGASCKLAGECQPARLLLLLLLLVLQCWLQVVEQQRR
jgi:hypothetical protein